MKNLIFIGICALVLNGCGYWQILKEQPLRQDLSRYKVIHLGWVDYPISKWKAFGYKSADEWQREINNLNRNALVGHFKEALPGKRFIGPTNTKAVPAAGDLFVRFDYDTYEPNFNPVFGGIDRIVMRVELFDIRKGKKIYSALVRIDANGMGPRRARMWGLIGRLDLELYNLANFVAEKFR